MKSNKPPQDHRNTTILLIALSMAMLVLAFASVPLYRMFCQATGFAGTPKIGVVAPDVALKKTIRARFNADISPELNWRFRPLQREMVIPIGQSSLAFFEVENLSRQPIHGWATYNVTPNKAAVYFVKMLCFCFSEQIIPAGTKMNLPVSFYIDPKWVEDKNMKDTDVITLSYTFFKFKG